MYRSWNTINISLNFLNIRISQKYINYYGIYNSSVTTINGVFIGPIWLPMLSVIPGLVVGLIVKKLLEVYIHKKK